jgi:hypothetical protein
MAGCDWSSDVFCSDLFRKNDPLVSCVIKALGTLTSNGTLHSLQKRYLQIYLSVPVIKP